MDALEQQGWEKLIDNMNGKRYKLHSMNISIWYDFMVGKSSMGGFFTKGEEETGLAYGVETLEAVVTVMKDMERECKEHDEQRMAVQ